MNTLKFKRSRPTDVAAARQARNVYEAEVTADRQGVSYN